MNYEKIIKRILKFRDDRNWEQFHNPKDLSIALNIESSELLECFLWKDYKDADISKIKEELSDILIYAFLLSNKLNFNLEEIINEKIDINEKKYPIEKSKNISKKYKEL